MFGRAHPNDEKTRHTIPARPPPSTQGQRSGESNPHMEEPLHFNPVRSRSSISTTTMGQVIRTDKPDPKPSPSIPHQSQNGRGKYAERTIRLQPHTLSTTGDKGPSTRETSGPRNLGTPRVRRMIHRPGKKPLPVLPSLHPDNKGYETQRDSRVFPTSRHHASYIKC